MRKEVQGIKGCCTPRHVAFEDEAEEPHVSHSNARLGLPKTLLQVCLHLCGRRPALCFHSSPTTLAYSLPSLVFSFRGLYPAVRSIHVAAVYSAVQDVTR